MTVWRNSIILAVLATASMWGQAVSGAAGGGGSSTLAGLTDVDETSRTEGDILKVNAGGDYVNTNILTAIGEDLATSGCVLFESAGSVGCASNFTGNGDSWGGNDTGETEINFGSPTVAAPAYTFQGDEDLGMYRVAANTLGISSNGANLLTIGGSQTLLVEDTTATTGDTSFIVKAGAGQSSNLQEWQSSTGNNHLYINPLGTNAAPFAAVSSHTGRLDLGTRLGITTGGALRLALNSGGVLFSSLSHNLNDGFDDLGIARSAAGVLKVTDGSTGLGYLQAGAFDLDDGGTQPTCDSSTRGYFWIDEGGAGVADSVDVCAKDSGDAYAWRTIY